MTRPIYRTTLPDAYFAWLYDQLFKVRDSLSWQSYTKVCRRMHEITFKDLIDYDENRIADAVGFRNGFLAVSPGMGPLEISDLMEPDATIFEVLYGLARRADDMIPMTVPVWFKGFIENLGLGRFNDQYCLTHPTRSITKYLNRFNDRTYKPNGEGGLFPLKHPKDDQREVELWYQMGAWMTEKHLY